LSVIDVTTGTNQSFPLSFCDSLSSTFPSFSALYQQNDVVELLVAVAGDSAVRAINVASGTQRVFAELPVYNSSDPFLGLISIGRSNVYLVSRFSLFSVSEGSVVKVAPLNLGTGGAVAAAPTGGSNNAPRIFFADFTSPNITVIDLGAGFAQSIITSSIGKPWDMQFSLLADQLIVLAEYQLYTVDPQSGKTQLILPIPDGPGYPRVNAITDDGSLFAFLDFASVYTISLTSTGQATIQTKAPFLFAPRVVGFPQFV
jgi:hypothetical protein